MAGTNNTVKVLSPQVLSTVFRGVDGPNNVSSVSISTGIDAPSQCQLQLQPATSEIGSLTLLDTNEAISAITGVIKTISAYLGSRGLVPPDLQLSVFTGADTITFNGYLSDASPSYGFSENGVTVNVTGPEAILGTVNPQVYKPAYSRKNLKDVPDKAPLGNLMAAALVDMASMLVSTGSDNLNYSDGEKALIRSIANSNRLGLEFMRRVLMNTTSATWDKLLQEASDTITTRDLTAFFMAILSNTSGDGLLSALRVLASSFGLVYIPDDASGVGALYDIVELLNAEPVNISLQMEQVNFFTSSGGVVTPRRTLVVGRQDFTRKDGVAVGTPASSLYSAPIISAYPSTVSDGFSLPIPTPPWWRSYYIQSVTDLTTSTYSTDNIKNTKVAATKEAEANRGTAGNILRYWAQVNYVKKLGNLTTASISGLPLQGAIKPGQMVRLIDKDSSSSLGQGLVTNVKHNLAVQDKRVDASTSISLSYVSFPD